MLSPDESHINETKVTEIEGTALPATNISDEYKLRQIKVDLIRNLRVELKNILAENKRDTDGNSRISCKKYTELLQEQLYYLKGENF